MQGLSAALLLSVGQLGPAAAWYRQEGGSECSWHRKTQPPELRSSSPSQWPWACSSEFRPPGKLQWLGPASAGPEGEYYGDSLGDCSPLPVRHLSTAREAFLPQGAADPYLNCSLVSQTLDEYLPDALQPSDGEAQSGPPALTPWRLQGEAARVARNLGSSGGWRPDVV